jgi:CIC family chloride channel protein
MNWRVEPGALIRDLIRAAILGLVSGLACVAVRLLFRLLQWLITGNSGLLPHAAEALTPALRAVIPAAGALVAMFVLWGARRFPICGRFEGYVEAVRLNGGCIPFLPTMVRTVSSAASVASGAAIGREGSMIQFASAAASWFGQRWAGRMPLATQVACGVAAAVAAAYQAPIAAVFFASEIVVGEIAVGTLPFLLVASFAGEAVGAWLLGKGPLFRVPGHLDISLALGHGWWLAVTLPLWVGLLGPLYYWILHSLRPMSKWPLALMWGGILVGLLSLKSSLVWGNGDAALLEIMRASPAFWILASVLGLRLLAVAVCVGVGTVGGVFTPTLFTGGALGYLAAVYFHMPQPAAFAMLSMAALLAAVTHAPLMATFMTVELTGQWSFLPFVLASAYIALAVAGKLSTHSLYAIATPEPANDRLEQMPHDDREMAAQHI